MWGTRFGSREAGGASGGSLVGSSGRQEVSSGGLSSGSSKPPLVPEVVPDVREVPRHRSLARSPCEETYLRKEKDECFK